MPVRKVGLSNDVPDDLGRALAALRATLEVPGSFPPEVQAAADEAAERPLWPELDRTDLELLTIDPDGSMDLDQALHIARRPGGGYVVTYAIADVAAFVTPGGPIDREAHSRVLTLYAPDHRTPLYPSVLSEGAASLLPDQVRPALLWTVTLGGEGQTLDADVRRARVRSRARLSYVEAQAEIDARTPREVLTLLREVGRLRERRERERGGVSLQIPEQQIRDDRGRWSLEFRAPLPVEGWNAQISLLTGMAAAHIMLYGQVGILRTMPPAEPGSLRRLRQTAKALHISWPAELDYPEFVRSLNPARATEAAMLNECTVLFRGAGYHAFSGGVPEDAEHAAIASDYAHVTAPMRRLADRYAGEVCVALCAGAPVPGWALRALDGLPAEMAAGDRRAKKYERGMLDLVEVCVLAGRVGETFSATVVDTDQEKKRGTVMLADPAVEARVVGEHLPLGHEVQVRLTSASFDAGAVTFTLV